MLHSLTLRRVVLGPVAVFTTVAKPVSKFFGAVRTEYKQLLGGDIFARMDVCKECKHHRAPCSVHAPILRDWQLTR